MLVWPPLSEHTGFLVSTLLDAPSYDFSAQGQLNFLCSLIGPVAVDSLLTSLDHQRQTRKPERRTSWLPRMMRVLLSYSASAGLVLTMRKRFSRVNLLSLKLTLRLMLSTLFNTMLTSSCCS